MNIWEIVVGVVLLAFVAYVGVGLFVMALLGGSRIAEALVWVFEAIVPVAMVAAFLAVLGGGIYLVGHGAGWL